MFRSPLRLVAVAVAVLIVMLAALMIVLSAGGDSPSTEDSSNDAISQLDIVDFAFDPDEATVVAGTALTIVNEDDSEHTVTSDRGDDVGTVFDLDLPSGATEELVIDDPGTYEYICTIHPGMKGTLEVVEP